MLRVLQPVVCLQEVRKVSVVPLIFCVLGKPVSADKQADSESKQSTSSSDDEKSDEDDQSNEQSSDGLEDENSEGQEKKIKVVNLFSARMIN
jgi:hypothetical protein